MRRPLFLWVLPAAFLLLFLLTQWNHWSGALERDEGEYAYAAELLRSGGMPYTESFMQKPPVIVYLYYLAQTISASSVVPIRVLSSLFLLATVVLTAWIACKRCGKVAGTAVLFFLPVLLANPNLYPFAANTEKFMVLPMMGVLALSTLFPGRVSLRYAVTAGALASAAVLTKPICIPILLCIFLFWMGSLLQEKPHPSSLTVPIGGWIAGAASAGLILCLPILAGGAWSDMWQCTVTFNRYYAQSLGLSFDYFYAVLSLILRQGWPLLIPLVALPFVRYDRKWADVSLLMVACLSLLGTAYGHYYIMLIPLWVLVSSCLLDSWLQTRWPASLSSRKGLCSGLAVAAITLLLLLPIRQQLQLSSEDLYFQTYPGNPFYESPLVAEQVAKITGTGDKIFIAGSEPQILYYAKRRSVTRFVIMYPLMLDTPLAGLFQEQTIRDLERTMPAVIVWSTSGASWLMQKTSPPLLIPYLKRMLQQFYTLQGGWIREGTEKGYWKGDITDADKSRSSLLVYRRK